MTVGWRVAMRPENRRALHPQYPWATRQLELQMVADQALETRQENQQTPMATMIGAAAAHLRALKSQ